MKLMYAVALETSLQVFGSILFMLLLLVLSPQMFHNTFFKNNEFKYLEIVAFSELFILWGTHCYIFSF